MNTACTRLEGAVCERLLTVRLRVINASAGLSRPPANLHRLFWIESSAGVKSG